MATKVAYRTLNKVWEYPLTRKDHARNLQLRREGMQLERDLDQA